MLSLNKYVRFINHMSILKGLSNGSLVSRSFGSGIPRYCDVYDVQKKGNGLHSSISFTHSFLGCHTVSANRSPSFALVPPAARGVVIGKVYNWFCNLNVEDVNSVLESFNHSAPVVGTRDIFLWIDSTYGLPWWVTIVLTTVALRTVLYAPAAVYMEAWNSKRELFTLDCIPISSRLRRAAGNREHVRELMRAKQQLLKEYNCQIYKFILALSWQVSNMILLSAGLRQCLLTFGGSGLRNAQLPWGSELGFPDALLILPLLNIFLNILMIEMDAWKLSEKNAELKMTLKRGSLEGEANQMIRKQTFALHVRRASCVFLLVIYASVPSALTLLWSVMLMQTLGFRLALFHPKVRRLFGIRESNYETSQPHRDFLLYLGRHLQRKSSIKTNS